MGEKGLTLTACQIAALREVGEVWPDRATVIIGATALGFYYDMRWRQTADVDLVLAVELDEFPGRMTERPGWTQHPTKEHEFLSPQGAKLDILPAGPGLLESGVVTWTSGHKMSLEALDLAFAHAEEQQCDDDYVARVAPPQVVTVLKMASYCDRPAERERDLVDIAHLLDSYVDEYSSRLWDEAGDCVYDLAPAYLLGMDVGRLAADPHYALISRFLDRVGDPEATEHAQMQRRGPTDWKWQQEPLKLRLDSFKIGLGP